MPQLSQIGEIYASQLFWLAIVFALIYFGIGKAMVPKIERTIEDRTARVSGDLAAAEVAFSRHGTFLDATPARLTSLQPGYIFVDGPSTTPEIVSIAATADTWAAAVQAPGGLCLWARAAAMGDVTHGIGLDCTGAAALSPPPPPAR